jgi:hypothetical protein
MTQEIIESRQLQKILGKKKKELRIKPLLKKKKQ